MRGELMLQRAASLLVPLLAASCGAPRPFTDQDLAALTESGASALLYTVSATMPLSSDGLSDILEVSDLLELPVIVLLDSDASGDAVRESLAPGVRLPPLRVQASDTLSRRGIGLHYPSLMILDQGLLLDHLTPGFKTAAAYEALVIDALDWRWEEEFRIARSLPNLPDVRGEFFKPIPGTSLVAVGWSFPGYLLDLVTGGITPMGDSIWGDAGATADGRYLTIVSRDMRWFSIAEMIHGESTPLRVEPGYRTYQSMGLLRESGAYRVLAAETSSDRPTGLFSRDYRGSDPRVGDRPSIEPVGPWTATCDGTEISVPMLSKGGRLVSGISGGTMRVFRIEPSLACVEIFDSGRVGGKAEFSQDDASMVFVSVGGDSVGERSRDVLVVSDLRERTSTVVYEHPASGELFFPAFLNDDEIVVFDRSVGGLSILERRRRVVSWDAAP